MVESLLEKGMFWCLLLTIFKSEFMQICKKARLWLLASIATQVVMPSALARDFSYTYEDQTLTYTVLSEEDKTCEIKEGFSWGGFSGNDVSGNLEIPEISSDGGNNYTVISIGNYAFNGFRNLTSVKIPNSVVSIGKQSFAGCDGLELVEIPTSVTLVGEGAFSHCYRLTSVGIPSSVTSISDNLFLVVML